MKKLPAVLLAVCLLLSAGCRRAPNVQSATQIIFDTAVTITLYDSDEAILNEAFSLCRSLEQTLSRTIETSEISAINRSAGEPVPICDGTAALLQTALSYCALSGGRFDITILPVSILWDFHSADAAPPDAQTLREAVNKVDYRQLTLSDDGEGWTASVQKGARIDLGGIAKGYIADQVAALLTARGVTSALIDLGGNIKTIGTKPGGAPFHVGVAKPFDRTGVTVFTLDASGRSVATSGTYERYFTHGGVRYHHLLDPQTGMPFDNGLDSVTILCPNAADADALSTVCFALGEREGLALVASLPETEAVMVRTDGTVVCSDGLSYE